MLNLFEMMVLTQTPFERVNLDLIEVRVTCLSYWRMRPVVDGIKNVID